MNHEENAVQLDGVKINDTNVFYARAQGLQVSGRPGTSSLESMLRTELSPVATSMFEDDGKMRSTPKAQLKKELAVEKSNRGKTKDSYFLDGCAVLWAVPYPAGTKATVQDYIDAFRQHTRRNFQKHKNSERPSQTLRYQQYT